MSPTAPCSGRAEAGPSRSFASQIAKVQGADLPDGAKQLIFRDNLRQLLLPILTAKGMKP